MSQLNEARTERTRDVYQTPEWYLELVRQCSDSGVIGLDPCTAPDNPTKALAFCDGIVQDGLTVSWMGSGLVYVNSPYGRALLTWAKKIVSEMGPFTPMIVLTPARPDTKWFDLLATNCTAQADHRKRITFKGCDNPAQFPSTTWYFGLHVARFVAAFKPHCRIRVGGLV